MAAGPRRATAAPAWLGTAALALLCWPYLASGAAKALDFAGASAEVAGLGLPAPAPLAALTVLVQLGGSALVIAGRLRWLGALALAGFTLAATLLAHAYWAFDPGPERVRQSITFGEHVGLVGAFLYVAWRDLAARRRGATLMGWTPPDGI